MDIMKENRHAGQPQGPSYHIVGVAHEHIEVNIVKRYALQVCIRIVLLLLRIRRVKRNSWGRGHRLCRGGCWCTRVCTAALTLTSLSLLSLARVRGVLCPSLLWRVCSRGCTPRVRLWRVGMVEQLRLCTLGRRVRWRLL